MGPAPRGRRDRRARADHQRAAPVAQAAVLPGHARRDPAGRHVAGGTHPRSIWSVFAARGMGYSASTTSANATHATAAFDTPPRRRAGAPDVTSAALEQDTVLHVPIVNPGTTPLTGVHADAERDDGRRDGAGGQRRARDDRRGRIGHRDVRRARRRRRGVRIDGRPLARRRHRPGAADHPAEPAGRHRQRDGRDAQLRARRRDPRQPADGGLTSTMNVATHGRVGDLRLTLAATHPWVGDLHASLTSPSGTTVDLFERPGIGTSTAFSPGNLVPTVPLILDDEATGLIQEIANANVTIGGALRPNEPLARFAGEDRFGTWTLRITDASNNGGGTLSSWSLETAAPACAVTDAPTGLVADGATFHARVDPGAAATSAAFELGATAAYGARSPATALTPAAAAGLRHHHGRADARRDLPRARDRAAQRRDRRDGGRQDVRRRRRPRTTG